MNKKNLFLIYAVLLIGMVSATATPLQEFMSNSEMTITITQDATNDVFIIDTSKCSWDNQEIPIEGTENTIPISISNLLSGIDLRLELTKGSTFPVFSNVNFSESDITLLNLIFDFSGIKYQFVGETIEDTQLLNTLAQKNSLEIESDEDYSFEKDGTTYTISYSNGFGDVSGEYKQRISEAIERGVNSINIKEMLEQTIFPSISIEDYLSVLEELNYEIGGIDFTNAILKNADYEVSVDLTKQKFQDGTYLIPVTISSETETIKKNITLVLKGVVNQVKNQPTTDGIYTPSDSDMGIKEVIRNIAGLPRGASIVKIQISEEKPEEVKTLSHTTQLKYLIIEVDKNLTSGAQINFSIEKSKVDEPEKVSLYVWETSTSKWTKLDTTYVSSDSDYHYYAATTPHFSTFMIAESTSSSSSNNPTHGGTVHYTSTNSKTSNESVETTTPTSETTKEEKSTFFQRLLKFLGLTGRATDGTTTSSGWTPIALIFASMVMILAIMILVVKRKNKKIRLKTAEILKANKIKI